ncbi:MAG TPA: hypothetical protein VF275_07610 [Gammaproteobacteria bacterium]
MSELEKSYRRRYETVLVPIAMSLEAYLRDTFSGFPRIDRIAVRAKTPESFLEKARKQTDGAKKYDDPLGQIQDQIGARVVTFYIPDVDNVAEESKKYFRSVEERDLVPDSEKEFDYIGKHFVVFVPTDVLDQEFSAEDIPKFFELQVKTLFQHAWAEANHDLAYKADEALQKEQKRQVAFTAAQAWGADHIFEKLVTELGASSQT